MLNAFYHDSTGLTEGQSYILSVDGDTDLVVDQSGSAMGETAPVNNGTGALVDIAGTVLAFESQPEDATACSSIPEFTVEVQDAFGNKDSDSTASITLSIDSNPGNGSLSGTNPVDATDGAALFVDIGLDKIGIGYTLEAISDGLGETTSAPFDISNTAPVLDTGCNPILPGIDEDVPDILNAGDTIAETIASSNGNCIADSDPGQAEGIAVTGVEDENGSWQYKLAGANVWIHFSASPPSESSAVLLNPSSAIRFVPDSNFNGAAAFHFRAWDQTLGEDGDTCVDTSVNGGTTPFSVDTETVSVTVAPVNDPPSFTEGNDQEANDDAGPQTIANWATNISAGPADESDQILTFRLESDNGDLFSNNPLSTNTAL